MKFQFSALNKGAFYYIIATSSSISILIELRCIDHELNTTGKCDHLFIRADYFQLADKRRLYSKML